MRTTFIYGVSAILVLLSFNYLKAQREEEPVFEIDKEIQRMYGTQAYLRDKGILCTGSGSEYPIRLGIKEAIPT